MSAVNGAAVTVLHTKPYRRRQCNRCQKTYHRVNVLKVWVKRRPGSRTGWVRAEVRECNECLTAPIAQRMLLVASVRVVGVAMPPAQMGLKMLGGRR